jgi:hypothetical protein
MIIYGIASQQILKIIRAAIFKIAILSNNFVLYIPAIESG